MRGAVALTLLLLLPATALARPDDDTTRIGLFLGPRYVSHDHFEAEAAKAGTPVTASTPWNGQALLSFAYKPEAYLDVALEVGYSFDSFTLPNAQIGVTSVPIVATARIAPWSGALYPYFGVGGGYMLNFFSGVPSGEMENHTYSGHALVGVAYDLTNRWTLSLEDRYEIALPDLVPIGQLQTGGNVVLLGLSFVFAPEPSLAPH